MAEKPTSVVAAIFLGCVGVLAIMAQHCPEIGLPDEFPEPLRVFVAGCAADRASRLGVWNRRAQRAVRRCATSVTGRR
jgi:hypothetical protein